jgi:hypothetical protein
MARLFTYKLATGEELLRMKRPRSLDHAYWCAQPGCDKRCASVYGWVNADGGFIGWRAACGRKHALAIWMLELTSPA